MKRKRFHSYASGLVVFLMALATVLSAEAQESVKFAVGVLPTPVHVARGMDLFNDIEKKHNVKLEFPFFSTGPQINEAMAAGEVQIASSGMGPAIIAAVRLPVKLLAIDILGQTVILVRSDSSIKSIADLKGKKVAHPSIGTQQYPILHKALADAGMSVKDIEGYTATAANIVTLLETDKVDAAVIFDPFASSLLVRGRTRILITASQVVPIKRGHYVGNGVYARSDFIEKHRALVQDIINANVIANELIITNPEKAVDMWAEQLKVPREPLAYSLRNGISVYMRDIAPDKETVEKYVEFLKSVGFLKPEDEAKYDDTFAQNALHQMQKR